MFAIGLFAGLVAGLAGLASFLFAAYVWTCVFACVCTIGFVLAFRAAYGESQH